MSRRNLLAGAGGLASLPLLNSLVPRLGPDGGAARAGTPSGGHHGGGDGPQHAGTVGTVDHKANGFDPHAILRDFDGGTVTREGGRTVRTWELIAQDKEIEVAPGVKYAAWTYNGRVPGPTLRATEGDRLRIKFLNGSRHPHTIHFHGIHRAEHDGVAGVGPGNIEPGEEFTYEFDAEPFGLHHYHCHTMPLAEHVAKGLYGMFIIDPKEGRPKADELVLVQNGFDTNFDRSNEIYAVNTIAFAYMQQPIRVKRGELVRMYLLNILEFDLINSMHLHGNFFNHFPTGTSLEPAELTDTIIQGQGQRSILELRFPFTGKYMFHPHVAEFAELGWMGFFEVVE